MAQEITAQAFLSVLKNGATDNVQANGAFDQSGDLFTHQVLTVVDEEQELDLGNLGSAANAFAFLRSLPDNGDPMYVSQSTLSDATDGAIILRPGEFFLGRWNAPSIHVWADGPGDLLEYFLIEA